MRAIRDRGEAQSLIQRHFKPGVRTNHFFSPEELEREIGQGGLLASQWEGGVAFYHRRAGFWRLSYYLSDLTAPFMGELPDGVVAAEIAHKPGIDHADSDFWLRQGFTLEGRRIRMTRPLDQPFRKPRWPVRRSTSADLAEISLLLRESFHPYLGCIPEGEKLERMAAQGQFLIIEDEKGRIGGIMDVEPAVPYHLLRHVAVREDLKGKGMGYDLMATGMQGETKKAARVWTLEGETPARRLYDSLLAVPDGWQSDLLLYTPQ